VKNDQSMIDDKLAIPSLYYTTEYNDPIKKCKIAGDSVQVGRLDFRSGRSCMRLTFT
jgi:hypothetical protein